MEYIDVMIGNQRRKYPLHTVKLLNADWDETGADVFIEYPSFAIGHGRISMDGLVRLLTHRLRGNKIHRDEPSSEKLVRWLRETDVQKDAEDGVEGLKKYWAKLQDNAQTPE